jgi:hypothetical protein
MTFLQPLFDCGTADQHARCRGIDLDHRAEAGRFGIYELHLLPLERHALSEPAADAIAIRFRCPGRRWYITP